MTKNKKLGRPASSKYPTRCLEPNPTSQSVLFCDKYINISYISLYTGLHISGISRVFRGITFPSIRSSRKIAQALGMEIGHFIRAIDYLHEQVKPHHAPPPPDRSPLEEKVQ